ncbi:FAD-dependent 5-carboxymethylaminomethyl-2-thiouridine(34) oxidoreductase MnmC [Neisseria perflava]|uniref:FAD-dependent 5-carboxymethylaminomethyl-2-thiouridine(34) oxidoreductase MnmC n=1 Tax=Neisseria perflava TaxID=33053 RepID=UPI00209C73F1|nr:FAD-dependent 5-carboxymethylaminomethyl-2-thiouridine(34) oxidoreductase MnmC [Neisseria perflava]MCP1659684.1 tRNA U-34 5-methylaminomethyl-2-thiouridine biosynthesis protein MnmC [Neisseria perflava]
MTCLAWNGVPPVHELLAAINAQRGTLHLLLCLTDHTLPVFAANSAAPEEGRLKKRLDDAVQCLQFNGMNMVEHFLPDVHLWLVPPACAGRLNEYFGDETLNWQTAAVPQQPLAAVKPWFRPSENRTMPEHVLIIGAGIAGAATARLLADKGVGVTVLEARGVAQGGSGNRQGLLYAKISPHPTEQTELLLAGYGYTRRLLEKLLPGADCWGAGGVVHLNFDDKERQRHQALAAQNRHAHLYHAVSQADIREISGLDFGVDGLYWPQGVWLNPPAVVRALLDHPLIEVREHTPLLSAQHDGQSWTAHTPSGDFCASHLVYCMGAHSPTAADLNIAVLPYRQIRGQTGVAQASAFSQHLRCAVSGESYISPAWQNQHCYGATFGLNSADEHWYLEEEQENRAALQTLQPELAQSLFSDGLNPLSQSPGHAALRCDSPDHLPLVGALGDIASMQNVYAKLALDKNYRLDAPCPYLPNAYLNTAHGTRGLATAPICAAAVVAEILDLPNPLSQRLRTALHPNRTVIRAMVRQQPLLPES